jgi:acyl carrier protein
MKNQEKLKEVFAEALGVDRNIITDELQYDGLSEWDSVGHMSLVAEIEEVFDIMIDNEDIIEMNSFFQIKEILKKYDVEF